MEEEGAELRRMKAELQLMKAQREAEKRAEAAAAGTLPAAAEGATASAAIPSDGYTILDSTPEPRVRPWNGGDVAWHTPPAAVAEETSAHQKEPAGPAARPRGRFEAFALRIVYEAGRTGFEEAKDFAAAVGSVVAGRYKVREPRLKRRGAPASHRNPPPACLPAGARLPRLRGLQLRGELPGPRHWRRGVPQGDQE